MKIFEKGWWVTKQVSACWWNEHNFLEERHYSFLTHFVYFNPIFQNDIFNFLKDFLIMGRDIYRWSLIFFTSFYHPFRCVSWHRKAGSEIVSKNISCRSCRKNGIHKVKQVHRSIILRWQRGDVFSWILTPLPNGATTLSRLNLSSTIVIQRMKSTMNECP